MKRDAVEQALLRQSMLEVLLRRTTDEVPFHRQVAGEIDQREIVCRSLDGRRHFAEHEQTQARVGWPRV